MIRSPSVILIVQCFPIGLLFLIKVYSAKNLYLDWEFISQDLSDKQPSENIYEINHDFKLTRPRKFTWSIIAKFRFVYLVKRRDCFGVLLPYIEKSFFCSWSKLHLVLQMYILWSANTAWLMTFTTLSWYKRRHIQASPPLVCKQKNLSPVAQSLMGKELVTETWTKQRLYKLRFSVAF